jgi:hypothetical protein
MDKLREAHEKVKLHPYRGNPVGSTRPYAEALYEMSSAFSSVIYAKFLGTREKNEWGVEGRRPGYDEPNHVKDFDHISHEFNTIVWHLREGGAFEADMVMLEKYIIQCHGFIDTGEWLRYHVWYKRRPGEPELIEEWEHVESRHGFEYTDDYLRRDGNRVLNGYVKYMDFWNNSDKDRKHEIQEECRYYYERIKGLGVKMTIDETKIKEFIA